MAADGVLLIRGSWGTGFRAPTFAEAFGGQTRGFATIVDPCAGPNFASLPGCGGRQAPANTTGTFVLSGGNPDLAARGCRQPDSRRRVHAGLRAATGA